MENFVFLDSFLLDSKITSIKKIINLNLAKEKNLKYTKNGGGGVEVENHYLLHKLYAHRGSRMVYVQYRYIEVINTS
jgi:hypothetical protein